MSIQIKAPTFPESVAEGEIASWAKKEGERVSAGEVIAEIETDKVVMEVQATKDGVLSKQLKKEGDTVKSQEVIGEIEEGAAAASAAPSQDPKAASAEPKKAPESAPAKAPASVDASPSVRRLVAEHDVDASKIQGSGKDGRLTPQDVKAHLSGASASTSSVALPAGARPEERVPMTRLRKTIAKRLLEVQQNAAILTTFNEVDMYQIQALRKEFKDAFEKAHGSRLGLMSFFVKATVEALKQFPSVNASIDGDDVVYHGYFDIGIAVSSPRGLVVPVLRNADTKSMADIEKEIREFSKRAGDGTLTIEEMQGGTFTITNGGTFGSMLSTPIINPPQSGILGMHNIVDRPMVVNGEIKIRPVMYIALSYDHRIIDGRESVSFLKMIKDLLENPARMVLGV